MKRWPILFVILALIMGLSVASTSGVFAETIKLRVASWMPAMSVDSAIADYWTKMVEERTNGRVKFTVYKASALGSFKDHYDLAVKGVADIALFSFGLAPGRFGASEVMHLPFVIPSSEVGGKVYNQLYKEFPAIWDELNETHVLGLGTTDVWNIQSLKRPIKTMPDLKGLKIRIASGVAAESVKALGGIPIGMPVPELYLSLQKGVVDGCVMGWEGIKSFKLYELLKNYTDVGGFTSLAQGLFMNKDSWNKLPPDIQKIMGEELGMKWWAEEKGKMFHDKWGDEAKELIESRGLEIYKLPPEERKKWIAAIMPIREGWVKSMQAKGVDGQKILNRLEELVNQYQ